MSDEAQPIEAEIHHDPDSIAEPPHEISAADRLRAFEDEKVGKSAVRINGRIERGFGSPFREKLTDADREHYARLEKLIEAEQAVTDAKSALLVAEAAYDAALAAVEG